VASLEEVGIRIALLGRAEYVAGIREAGKVLDDFAVGNKRAGESAKTMGVATDTQKAALANLRTSTVAAIDAQREYEKSLLQSAEAAKVAAASEDEAAAARARSAEQQVVASRATRDAALEQMATAKTGVAAEEGLAERTRLASVQKISAWEAFKQSSLGSMLGVKQGMTDAAVAEEGLAGKTEGAAARKVGAWERFTQSSAGSMVGFKQNAAGIGGVENDAAAVTESAATRKTGSWDNFRTKSGASMDQVKAGSSGVAAAEAGNAAEIEAANERKIGSFNKVGDNFGKVGAGIVAVSGVVIGVTVDMAAKFQSSTQRLVSSAGEVEQNLDMVRQGILAMAGQVGFSAEQLSVAMYKVESGGQHGADGLKVLQAAAQGAKTENADLTTVSDALTSAMTDYHAPASSAADITSKLVAATASGKMTFQELAGSMSNILPVASAAHVSLNDILADEASMTIHGESAKQASQNLANAIRNFQAPSQTAQKEFALLGLNAQQVSDTLGTKGLSGTVNLVSDAIRSKMGPGAAEVLIPLQNAFKGLAPPVAALGQRLIEGSISAGDYVKQAKALNPELQGQAMGFETLAKQTHAIGGAQVSGAQAMQTYAGALSKATGGATGMNVALMIGGENAQNTATAFGAVSAASADGAGNVAHWNEIQGTFNQKLSEAKDGFGALAIQIGTIFLPILTAILGPLGTVAGWLGAHKDAAMALAIVVGTVLVTGIVMATIAMWGMVTALTTASGTPIVLIVFAIVAAIALLAFGIYELNTHWSTVWNFLNGLVWGFYTGVILPVVHGIAAAWNWLYANALAPVGQFFAIVFNGIATVAVWLWHNIIQPVADGIGLALRILGAVLFVILVAPFLIAFKLVAAAATWLWQNAIDPACHGIGVLFHWLYDNTIKPVVDLIKLAIQGFEIEAMFLWHNVIEPAWHGIGVLFHWLYDNTIKPVVDLIKLALQGFGIEAMFLWHNVIDPAWHGIEQLTQTLYDATIKPVVDLIKLAIRGFEDASLHLWHAVIDPVWHGIGEIINFTWTNVIHPAFEAVAGGLEWLGRGFQTSVDNIGNIWNKIRGFLSKPINFLINTVWNDGILKAWNMVAGLISLPPVAPLTPIPEFASGGPINAVQGGPLVGPGNGTSDSILARVSAGEFVVREAIATRVPSFLAALNDGQAEAVQAAGGSRAGMGYAAGGPVGADPRVAAGQQFAQSMAGKPYIWGGTGPAGMDCSGFTGAVTHVLRGESPFAGRIGTTNTMPWPGFAPGLGGAWSLGWNGQHMAGTLCIVGSMLIDGPNGPRRIDEIEPGEWVWSYDEGRCKPHQVMKAWFTARQDVSEVRMSKGRSVTGSANHPFLVVRKQAGKHWGPPEMEPADWTPNPARQPYGAKGRDQCSVSTCTDTMWVHHLCQKHNQMLVTHGDPRIKRSIIRERWDTEWVRLDDLRRGDLVVRSRATEDTGTLTELPDGTEVTPDTAWLIGHLVGDGALTARHGIRVSCYKDEYRDHVLNAWKALTGKDGRFYGYNSSSPPVVLHSQHYHDVFAQMGMCVKGPVKRVPADVWRWPRHLQEAFLDGYADADGCYSRSGQYVLRSYTSASERLIAETRAMHIAHGDGVSNVQHRKCGKTRSTYAGATDSWSFDVYAGADDNGGVKDREGLRDFMFTWGGEYTLSRVQSVTPKGEQDTYDITVEGAHSFSVDGIQLHNSGVNIESAQTPIIYPGAHGADSGQFTGKAFLPQIGGAFAPGGAGGGGGGFLDIIGPQIRAAFELLTNPVIAAIKKLTGPPPPAYNAVPGGIATTARDKLLDFMLSKVPSGSGGSAEIGPLGASHAADIVSATKSKGLHSDAATIAIMTGLAESGLRVLANPNVPASMGIPHEGIGSDHDSVGIFQQRQSWGPTPLLMNPFGSAQLFLNRLGGGPYGDFGSAAQRVQVSAFPGAYSKFQGQAAGLVGPAFASGGIVGAMDGGVFGGSREGGGTITPGSMYLVGERGPELVVPRSPGMVLPAPLTAALADGGGGGGGGFGGRGDVHFNAGAIVVQAAHDPVATANMVADVVANRIARG